jgi:hypothetical protein
VKKHAPWIVTVVLIGFCWFVRPDKTEAIGFALWQVVVDVWGVVMRVAELLYSMLSIVFH